jgi:hypothetical protein
LLIKNGLNFKDKNIKINFKLVTDLLAFWVIFGKEFGWGSNKKFCPYCDQCCDKPFLSASAGNLFYK